MSDGSFWSIIENANSAAKGNPLRTVGLIKDELRARSDEDLQAFADALEANLSLLDRWDIVNAMAVIHGNVSDDLFADWRAGLILKGKSVFENALLDVQSLADLDGVEPCERLLYAADLIWDQRHPMGPNLKQKPATKISGENPVKTVTELKTAFPRLTAKFWGKWKDWSPYRGR